jgi:hypothetical protein
VGTTTSLSKRNTQKRAAFACSRAPGKIGSRKSLKPASQSHPSGRSFAPADSALTSEQADHRGRCGHLGSYKRVCSQAICASARAIAAAAPSTYFCCARVQDATSH